MKKILLIEHVAQIFTTSSNKLCENNKTEKLEKVTSNILKEDDSVCPMMD